MIERRLQQMGLLVDQAVLLAPVLPHDVGDFGLQDRDVAGTGLPVGNLKPAIVPQHHHEGRKALAGSLLPRHRVRPCRQAILLPVQILACVDRREIVVETEAGLDQRLHIGQQIAELGIAGLQSLFGKECETVLHRHHGIGEVSLYPLLRLVGDLELARGPVERIEGLFEILGLFPDLRLKGDGGFEERIGGATDFVAALGPVDQRLDDPCLLGDLKFVGLVRIDHSGAPAFGRKKATPTKVWFTCTPRCCSP